MFLLLRRRCGGMEGLAASAGQLICRQYLPAQGQPVGHIHRMHLADLIALADLP
jgi:hypothetical protein